MTKCYIKATALTKRLQILLDKCGRCESLVKQILSHSMVLGLLSYQHLACKLLNVYAKLNKPIEGRHMFDEIPNPDIISWTSLLNLYLANQQPEKSLSLFSEFIVTSSLKPDPHSMVAAVSACARSHNLKAGKEVHAMVYRILFNYDTIVSNALIDMYSRAGNTHWAKRVFHSMECKDVATWTSLLNGHVLHGEIKSARKLFDEMPFKNVVSWSAMIVGYVRVNNPIEALELFRRMRAEGRNFPTSITIVAVLSGCADAGALEFGMLTHGYVQKVAGLAVDVAVSNGLIDMYAKGGNLEAAVNVFTRIVNKDLFSWTSMISGFAFHGKGKQALELFNELVASGMTPNGVTFLSVLSACVHGGLVNEGQSVFEKLLMAHNIEPTMEHYGCMVHLLGRAGHFFEALELIKSMPMNPDAVIWRSLLSASSGHRNIDIAEMAGNKILELEPDDDGVYVLLWNLYRSKNRWEEASRVAKLMKVQRIKKTPGCSWVEVDGLVHEFLADGHMKHMDDNIFEFLEGLAVETEWLYADQLD